MSALFRRINNLKAVMTLYSISFSPLNVKKKAVSRSFDIIPAA
jgi:hypothetical protein